MIRCTKCGSNRVLYDNHKERYKCSDCYERFSTITRKYCPICRAELKDSDIYGLDGMSAFSSNWIQCLKGNHQPFLKRELISRET